MHDETTDVVGHAGNWNGVGNNNEGAFGWSVAMSSNGTRIGAPFKQEGGGLAIAQVKFWVTDKSESRWV